MRFAPALVTALSIAAGVCAPRSAGADPVIITSGFLAQAGVLSGQARLAIQGQDFTLDLALDGFFSTVAEDCVPCLPGTTLNLDGELRFPLASGTATVDGVSYPQIFADGMSGTFTTDSFVISGEGPQTISLPFVYAGAVTGYLENPRIPGDPNAVFTKTLTGSGIATATFAYAVSGDLQVFTVTGLRYDFSDTEPVPEPTSMLLLGTGLAGIAALRRRRARGTGSDDPAPPRL